MDSAEYSVSVINQPLSRVFRETIKKYILPISNQKIKIFMRSL